MAEHGLLRPVTGLVLAGGQGTRMAGHDKGLETFQGQPLARRALQRLQAQQGRLLADCMISANRHVPLYQSWGVPVWRDVWPDFAGPLAGFHTGWQHCSTPFLLTVPCDTPHFPLDLLERLMHGLQQAQAPVAVACTQDTSGTWHRQPVFCLMQRGVEASLAAFLHNGGRKIGQWLDEQRATFVPFDRPGDAEAFTNINTLHELHTLSHAGHP